jgi:5-methylcytosine-specific restriction endonuclease McrA
MKKISSKRATQERILKKYRDEELPRFCEICGRPASVGMHILPRSLYPEYYTERWNIAAGCEECHAKFDNDLSFRQKQTELFNRVKQHDPKAAARHFKIFD